MRISLDDSQARGFKKWSDAQRTKALPDEADTLDGQPGKSDPAGARGSAGHDAR